MPGIQHNHQVKSGPSAYDAETALRLAMKHFRVLLLIALSDGYPSLSAKEFDITSAMPSSAPAKALCDAVAARAADQRA